MSDSARRGTNAWADVPSAVRRTTAVRICPKDGTVVETVSAPDHGGRVLDGRYRLDSRLGAGGMGLVYRATHLMLDKVVAVKLITPDLIDSNEAVRRFQREARAASHLHHPNIALAHDFGQTADGTLYIAMEFVDGVSLKEVIQTDSPLDIPRIARILTQIAEALSYAHAQLIVHRDLKPQNIMLTRDRAGREVVKLLDFGIAKTLDGAATQLTATMARLGTPSYMSPEQVRGDEVDNRTDLYALGVIAYELLVGEVPFRGPSPTHVMLKHETERPQRPSERRADLRIYPDLEAIAMRCLEKAPADRFQSAEELIAALSAFHSTAESLPRNDADHDRHTVRIDSRRDLLAAEDERRVNESQPNGHEVDAALQSVGRHLLAGSLEQADAAVAEAIRINVTPQVLAVKKRIVEATRARHQEEMAARANRAVGDAVSLFLEGKHAEAIATLEQHEPRHPLVTGALEKMRSELERARGRAAEEPPAVQLPQPATAAEFDAQAPATRTFRHAIAEPALEEPIPPPEASRAYRTGQALGFTVRWLVALGTAAIAVELTDSAIRYLGAVSLRPELAESTVAIFLFLR